MRILMCVNGPSPNVGKQCVLQALMCIWAICDFSLLWAYRKTCRNLHPLLVLPTVSLVSWFRRGNHLFDHGFSSQINACVCPFFVLSSPYESDCCFACVLVWSEVCVGLCGKACYFPYVSLSRSVML
jgi:hypothetical protein